MNPEIHRLSSKLQNLNLKHITNMKPLKILIAMVLTSRMFAADVPDVFKGLFEPNVQKKGQIGMVVPPREIDKFIAKVEAAARKEPKWFREFSAQSKPGVPLPFDERLGLTREEYAEYLALWNKREFKPMEDVMLVLRQATGNGWTITATGNANMISTLRFLPKEDVVRSPNGDLKRIDDIKADATSILGEWTGREWKFEEQNSLGTTKENIAVGRFTKQPFGLLVYRAQELSSEGTRLLDRSLVVRFPIKESTAPKAPAEAEKIPVPEKKAASPKGQGKR